MSASSFISKLADMAVGILLYAPIGIGKLLPYRWRIPATGWITSRLVAPLARYRRRICNNLAHVLPDLPEHQVQALCREVPDNAGRNLAELFSTDQFIARAKAAPRKGPGWKHVHEARAKGRPVIIISAHFGSFNAARIALVDEGFHMGVFYRRMANEWFNARYTPRMGALSEPMFEQGRTGMRDMVRHMRSGGMLAILADLNAHDGVPLNYFGKPALTPLTPAELALKFDALLVPIWGIRADNGLDFEIILEEPIKHSDSPTMAQEINDRLEARVRDHMGQWLWIHKRWKDGTGPLAERGQAQLDQMRAKS